jgi:predicted negative regulator of RcsB-dependent stress response
MYEEVLKEAVTLWQKPGDGLEQAIQFLRGHVSGAKGELRGRFLSLLGEFYTFGGMKSEAFTSVVEAIELVKEPAARVIVLVAAINACIPFMKIAQGVRYVEECKQLLDASTDEEVYKWRAQFHRNTGDLLMRAGDYGEASTHLRKAVGVFESTGRHQEALRSQVDLAECLMYTGELDTALSLCRGVRLDNTCKFVLGRLAVVQAMISARLGRVSDAERNLDQATVELCEKFDGQDRRTWKLIELAKVEIALAKGNGDGAKTLKHYADRLIAAIEAAYGS